MHRTHLTRWLILAIVAVAAPAAGADTDLQWPLTLQRALSSTFAETRGTALHFGIDLKTWGKTGFDVRAVASGSVMRLRTSPWGYGRAIYQKIADGRIVVYAHLDSLMSPLAERVYRAQQEAGRYTTDVWLEAGEIPIEQGQVIATTGDTGAGYPHLHLELRTASNVPLNLLSNGFDVPDGVAPTIQRVALVPLDLTSRVNGRHGPHSMAAAWNGKTNRFEVAEIPFVEGRIGASVKAYDRADGAQNKLAPYRHDLLVDGMRVFTAQYDRIPIEDAHQVGLDRLTIESPDGNTWDKGYFNLSTEAGNRLPFYKIIRGAGEIIYRPGRPYPNGVELAKGEHRVDIVCADAAGNESQVRFTINADMAPRFRSVLYIEDASQLFVEADLRDPDDEWLTVTLSSREAGRSWKRHWTQRIRTGAGPFTWELPDNEPQLWKLLATGDAGASSMYSFGGSVEPAAKMLSVTVRPIIYEDFVDLIITANRSLDRLPRVTPSAILAQIDTDEYVATLPFENLPGDGTEPAIVTVEVVSAGQFLRREVTLSKERVEPGEAAKVVFTGGDLVLGFARNSLYRSITPQVQELAVLEEGELTATGTAYDIGPRSAHFDRPVQVSMRTVPGLEARKLAVFAATEKGRWVFAGNEFDADSTYVSAKTRQLGRFALFFDDVKPIVHSLQPPPNSEVRSRRPRLSAAAADSGCGIGREDDVQLLLDGSRLISIYDPDADQVVYEPRQDLSRGEHELQVVVRDNCANETRKRSVFRIR